MEFKDNVIVYSSIFDLETAEFGYRLEIRNYVFAKDDYKSLFIRCTHSALINHRGNGLFGSLF